MLDHIFNHYTRRELINPQFHRLTVNTFPGGFAWIRQRLSNYRSLGTKWCFLSYLTIVGFWPTVIKKVHDNWAWYNQKLESSSRVKISSDIIHFIYIYKHYIQYSSYYVVTVLRYLYLPWLFLFHLYCISVGNIFIHWIYFTATVTCKFVDQQIEYALLLIKTPKSST